MIDALNSYIKTKALIESAVSIKLLRARNLGLIMSFLNREFKLSDQITIPYPQLIQKLGDFLEEMEYHDEDEEVETGKLILDYLFPAVSPVSGTLRMDYAES